MRFKTIHIRLRMLSLNDRRSSNLEEIWYYNHVLIVVIQSVICDCDRNPGKMLKRNILRLRLNNDLRVSQLKNINMRKIKRTIETQKEILKNLQTIYIMVVASLLFSIIFVLLTK